MIFDFILSSSKQNAGISLRSVYKNIAYHEWLINKLWAQVSTFNGLAPINHRRGQVSFWHFTPSEPGTQNVARHTELRCPNNRRY